MEMNDFFDFSSLTDLFEMYRTYVMTALVLVVGGLAVGSYLYFSSINYERASQQALSELLLEYNRSYHSPDLWNDVEVGARTAYKQYGKSAMAPYFLFIQAEALYQQKKTAEALNNIRTALSNISTSSPLFYLYKSKQASILLEQDNEVEKNQGLAELQELARNEKNPQQDKALYDLAHYYDKIGSYQQAEEARGQLLALKPQFKEIQSPWIALTEQQMA